MKITRIIWTDGDDLAFEDVEIELSYLGTTGSPSKSYPVTSVVFRDSPRDVLFPEDARLSGHRTANGEIHRSVFIRREG